GARAPALAAGVARALEALEAHGLCAGNVTPETVVMADDGRPVLSPAALALAPPRRDSSAAGAAMRHAAALGALAHALAPAAGDPHGKRLRAAADAVGAGTIIDAAGFLRALDGGTSEPTRSAAAAPAGLPAVPRDAALVGIVGGAHAGKTAIVEAILREEDSRTEVCRVDEWELLGRARRKGGGRERAESECWLVDDIEDIRYGLARLEDHLATGGRVIYTAGPATLPPETGAFLEALRQRAEAPVETITLAAAPRSRRGAVARSLRGLDPDDQRLLELCAVAGHALPLALLAAVFGETDGDLPRRLHGLARAGLVALDYRPLPPAQEITVAVSVPSASLRRKLRDAVPEPRRSNLHRTLARLGASVGAFPAPLVYHHLVRGGDAHAAARQALVLLRETTREARAPYLDALVRELLEQRRCETLAYADRLRVLTRLGADLFSRGRRADAERLLVEARDLEAEPEELARYAPLLSETMRLLADVWAARSNFTQARELLEEARELLKAHLSLAEQAQLMNEIGWLQYRLGDYESAVDSCKLSLTTLNPNEHPLVVAQALNLTGVIHYNTSRYDEAISYYERSAFLREREGDRNALAGSYNNLALAYQSKGEYDKALAAYDRSLEIKKEQNNEAGIANGYLNLALLHLEIHNYEEAEKRCRESLRISTTLGMAQLIAENHSTLGDIAFRRGSYEEAEKYYRKSLALAQSLETTNEEMGALRRLAKLYFTTARAAEARQSIEEAARLARQIGSKYETAQIEGIRGELAAGESLYAEAIEHFEKSASAYASVSRYRDAGAALARIGQAHVKTDNSFEARHYLDRALDVVKSDIGFEIPDEIVTLQQLLREQPGRRGDGIGGTAAQKLLYAFYELSALTDFADDVRAFCERALRVFQDLTGASTCMLALQAEEGTFVNVRAGGEREPLVDPALRTLFARALQLGTLLTSESEEAGDVAGAVEAHAGPRFACVPMKAMGRSLGCVLLAMPASSFPLSKYDANFIAAIGRHVAGDLRLMFHLQEHAHKEETLEKEFESLREQVVDRYRFQNLIGKDESMK
ncbi:MAG: tetratricopeptide repeat-containing serine/threonine-protein kinase, partial [Myxococcales bacterium]|nr:tetratricopeptide repeat-containing serine/threonine-protein kinase [Myxococcales bacterium]